MNTYRNLAVLCLLLSIAGCAAMRPPKLWVKRGATTEEFNEDKYACLQQSQQFASGSYSGIYGATSNSGMTTNITLYSACMNAKGYSLKSN